MSDKKLILVTGATGKQGGAVAKALLARGYSVRAFTRNSSSEKAELLRAQGIEIVQGDFSDLGSLVNASIGVDGVFAMGTPFEMGTDKETTQGISLLEAAKIAEVNHFVYSSVASADKMTGIPHFESKFAVEKATVASGLPYTIIAPVFFMENFLSPWLIPGIREGKLSQAMPGTRSLQQIAVSDIGEFAATIFDRGESVFSQRYDLAGDDLTGDDVAAILSQVTEREIVYQGFPPDALREQSEDLAIMYEWFDKVGYSTDFKSLHKDFPEVKWHNFKSWAEEQDWGILDKD